MSFFGNVKNISVSTAKAINNGIELLNDLADEAQKSSELLLIKTKASNLEKDINHLIINSSDPKEINEKRKTLSKKYHEIIDKTLAPERDEYVIKNKSIKKEITLSHIGEIEKIANSKEQALSVHKSNLAIDEIHRLESIKADLAHLLRITKTSEHKTVHQNTLEKISHVTSRVAALQEKRYEEIISTYPSGEKKSKTRLYDGENHGLSEFWYENGNKKKEIAFSHGKLSGTSKYWRNDGTILSEVEYKLDDNSLSHSVFSRNGTKIIESSIKKNTGFIDFWLSDESFVCRAKIKNNKTRKIPALIMTTMRKNVWVNLYKARKPGFQQDQLNDMSETIDIHAIFFDELLKHLTHGKST